MAPELSLLRKAALFELLSDEQLRQILARCETREYKAGDVVITEGEQGEEMYIVRSGRVAVSKAIKLRVPGRGEVNFEKQLATLAQGSYFGEVALLASDTRSATVTALSDLEVWVLRSGPMQELMEEDRELGYRLLTLMSRELCNRLRRANEDIQKLLMAFAIAINK